jgi:PAS domain S-box-containing protein
MKLQGESKGDSLRKRAEKVLSQKPQDIQKVPVEDMRRLIHELDVHQIELDMQNEELRRQQTESDEAKARYRNLYDFAPIGYFTFDPDGRIAEVNLTGARLLGLPRSRLIGRLFSVFVERDFLALFRMHLQEVFASDVRQTCELKIRQKPEKSSIYVSIESIAAGKGGEIKCRSAFIDITEHKRMEEDRTILEVEIQRLEKMEALGTLAGGVAHDLNNILTGLVGYPDLILMQLPDSSPLREPILAIKQSGQKAAATVQDLLTLTRRGMVSMEAMNLNRVISVYMKTPEQGKTQSFHPDVQFEVSLKSDLLPIKGSPVHLSKTVMNLLSNATEAIPERGVVTISTRNQYLDRPIKGYDHVKEGDYVVLKVSDTGRGISPEDMGRIFEPY